MKQKGSNKGAFLNEKDVMSFQDDIASIETVTGQAGMEYFFKEAPRVLAEDVQANADQGPLFDADQTILVRHFSQEVLNCPNLLLQHITNSWHQDHESVRIDTSILEDDTATRSSRAISVFDRLREHFGSNWFKITIEPVFCDDEAEPLGWAIRPRSADVALAD